MNIILAQPAELTVYSQFNVKKAPMPLSIYAVYGEKFCLISNFLFQLLPYSLYGESRLSDRNFLIHSAL